MIDPDLARAIDECHARLLQDAAADETDPVAAKGWLWLLERWAWPTLSAGRWVLWPLIDEDMERLGSVGNWFGVPPGEDSANGATASAALAAAALTVGRWLQRQESQAGGQMTSPPSAPCEACGGTGEVQGKDSDDVDLCWACGGTGREGP